MADCQHRELKWNISAETSVMVVRTSLWGVECLACGKKWDVGQVMQALVDLEAKQAEVEALRRLCSIVLTHFEQGRPVDLYQNIHFNEELRITLAAAGNQP